jgi:very-short-patch-repair endonuclease
MDPALWMAYSGICRYLVRFAAMNWWDLARRQSGVVTRQQLSGQGLHRSAIQRMLDDEKLVSVARATYLVRGAPLSYRARLWVATLSTAGILAFATAAELWGLIGPRPGDAPVHVVLPHSRQAHPPAWVRVHRLPVPRSHVVVRDELPRTSKAWTLCDYLPTLRSNDSIQLADRALQRRWISAADIAGRLSDFPGRYGNRQLRALLELTSDGAAAKSERLLHKVLRRAGISGWQPNYEIWVGGTLVAVVDIALPHRRIAIEVDGLAYHTDAERFQGDRTRQNGLVAARWTILRFTWADITERPEYIITAIQNVAA